MTKYCFGIDIGGTSIKCGLFDIYGDIIDKWEITTRTEHNGVHILPDAANTIKDKMKKKNIKAEDILGVGIGIPGPVNQAGEISCAVNLHWGYVHVVEELEALTGLTVKAGNDANMAALGEMYKGGAAGCHNVVLVTLGTGVGGGIIVQGQMITGTHGAGGEIGHIHVDDNEEEKCNCGGQGCLEQSTSATGIVRLAKKALSKSTKDSLLRGSEISAKLVFDGVKENDELAIEIVEQFGEFLGKALSMISCVVDPQVYVIGGGVSKAGPVLIHYIQKYYQKYAFPACRDTIFSLAELGNDAGIYGGAKLILE